MVPRTEPPMTQWRVVHRNHRPWRGWLEAAFGNYIPIEEGFLSSINSTFVKNRLLSQNRLELEDKELESRESLKDEIQNGNLFPPSSSL